MSDLIPQKLQGDAEALQILWKDGRTDRLSWRFLREHCPCANCRAAEASPPDESPDLLPVLSPAEAQPLRVLDMRPVGNYAYAIQFSDGHTSGIFSLDYLRRLGDQAAASQC
ncbi:MAG: DUF971 domain-containing protein [Maioricimonas sp. JB045]